MQKQETAGSVKGWHGDMFLAAAVFAWGVNFPTAKVTLQFMHPMVFSGSRYFVASFFLFGLLKLQRIPIAVTLKEIKSLIVVGLVGITLFQGCWSFGLNLTTASKASILITTSPIFAALIATFRGNRPGFFSWVGIFLSLAGVAIVINNGLTNLNLQGGSFSGDMLIIGAAGLWATYSFVAEPVVSRMGAMLVTAWSMLFGSLILFIFSIPSFTQQNWESITTAGWIAWGYNVFFGAALAFVWYSAGVVRLGVSRGIVYSYFIPVIAILVSVLFLNESLSPLQLFGAAVVLTGVILTRSF